jgi:hypothetical protein
MGMQVGRIEKEFVFKALVDDKTGCDVHGRGKEAQCVFASAGEERLEMTPAEGALPGFETGEEVRVFFYLKNNYHTFTSRVVSAGADRIVVEHPRGVYKNLQRKFERVKPKGEFEVSFSLKGKKVELNFPKTERIHDLVISFRKKMAALVSDNKILMMRDRVPRSWEEKMLVRTGKSLWIPSTEEDFPAKDPFPDERVITKGELIRMEEENGAQPYVISGKLGNILFEKSKKGVASELWCPILYNEYLVGYIHVWNAMEKKERVSRELMEYIQQFSKVISYSLVTNGYFRAESSTERRYEAPIIDLSASGLLFAHTAADLIKELHVHTDLALALKLENKTLSVGARIMRKFKDAENTFFGVLFLRIEEEDFKFLFQFLYGKPFDAAYEGMWEGGAPPPPVEL